VQTIKSIAAGPWAGRPHTHHSWYMPLQDQADIDLSVWWSLARPGFFVNSVADISLLPKVLDAASRFSERCPTEDEMRALIQRRQVEHLFA